MTLTPPFDEAAVVRDDGGKFGEKTGARPEVTLPRTLTDFESWVDRATGYDLTSREEERLTMLYYKVEQLRTRQAGRNALNAVRTLDPRVTGLTVAAGYGSDGHSVDLIGVHRDDEYLPVTDDPQGGALNGAFWRERAALSTPGALEGVFKTTGEQDDYLRPHYRIER